MDKVDIWVSLAVFAKAPATILNGRFRAVRSNWRTSVRVFSSHTKNIALRHRLSKNHPNLLRAVQALKNSLPQQKIARFTGQFFHVWLRLNPPTSAHSPTTASRR